MPDKSEVQKKFAVVAVNGEDKAAELQVFSRFIGLDAATSGRYSILLLLQLFAGYASRMLNPAKVIHEIRALEGIGRPSNTKQPETFKRPPLKGLWHKHYLADGLRTMAINLRNGIEKDGLPWFEQRAREAQDAGEEHFLTEQDINALTHDAVVGNWMRRAGAMELTGEWIIYAQHEGANYYLCLGEHNSGDANLRAQIDAVCCHEFPFLTTLLAKP